MHSKCLSEIDPEIHNLITKETERQAQTINLIASENFTPVSILQANASVFTNKYSEGYPFKRYYAGTENVDTLELLCQKRALELFNLNEEWGVNVQALSGTPANFAVYTALIGPQGKLMGLDLPSGGHLTHGYQRNDKKISATSLFFQSKPYKVGKNNLLDYDSIKKDFDSFNPDILVCGGSAYPRDFDYKKFREICGNKFLMADIAHTSGLIACKKLNNPFEFCDVVTMTTHKTLRGPRAALIFYKKTKKVNDEIVNLEEKINFAVFPALQGGPHNQTIAAIAVALKIATTDEYKKYIDDVIANSKLMADELLKRGYNVLTGGTDCHFILVDISNFMSGTFAEKICEKVNIIVNKNSTPDTVSPFKPKGVRIGSCAMTTREMQSGDFKTIIDLFDRAIKIGLKILIEMGKENLVEFEKRCDASQELIYLKKEVIEFVRRFPTPTFNYLIK